MDNITHSLVGALTAETSLSALKLKRPGLSLSKKTRVAFWVSAIVANNFNDIDFILGFFLKPTRLQYLLHHRGHTHTLSLVPVQAILILGLFWILTRWRKVTFEKFEWVGVTCLVGLGLVLHIFLDFLNQYGVHPFWPFDNRWLFGDMMFIVEPFVWITLLPSFFYSTQQKYFRIAVLTLLASGMGLIWFTRFVPTGIATAVTLWGVLLLVLFRSLTEAVRLGICYLALFCFLVLFALESHWLRQNIRQRFEKELPGVVVNDVILSPFPTNPICWQVVTVETLPTRINVKLKRGVVSIFSHLYSPEECLQLIGPSLKISKTHPQVIWTSEVNFKRQDLKKLFQENCFVAAQMKFLRAPFWYTAHQKTYLADLRFETPNRSNFSRVEIIPHPTDCPKLVPPWEEPRRDLLAD